MNKELMSTIRALISKSIYKNGMLSDEDVRYLISVLYGYSNLSFEDIIRITQELQDTK